MLKRLETMITEMDNVIKKIDEINHMRGEIALYLPEGGEEETVMLDIITDWMHAGHHAYRMKKDMEKLAEILKNNKEQ